MNKLFKEERGEEVPYNLAVILDPDIKLEEKI